APLDVTQASSETASIPFSSASILHVLPPPSLIVSPSSPRASMNPTACSSMEYGLTSIGSVGHTYSRNPSLTAPDPPSSTPIYNLCSSETHGYSADAAGGDASVELTRWCSHTAAPVGDLIFVWRLPTDENIANGQSLLVHDQRKYRSMLIYTNSSISKPEDWECKPTPKKFFVWFYGTDEIVVSNEVLFDATLLVSKQYVLAMGFALLEHLTKNFSFPESLWFLGIDFVFLGITVNNTARAIRNFEGIHPKQ
ncbi:hypothetical protein ACJX0J_024604, partial [Zea mays]